jgi:hypothetical protein
MITQYIGRTGPSQQQFPGLPDPVGVATAAGIGEDCQPELSPVILSNAKDLARGVR